MLELRFIDTMVTEEVKALADLHAQGIDVLGDEELFQLLFEAFLDEMPYGVAKARDGDPHEWLANKLDAIVK